MSHMAYLELVSAISSMVASYTLYSMAILTSRSNSAFTRKPKKVVDPQSSTAIELRHNADREELASASGTKALTLSFEALTTLLSLIPSSVYRGAFCLLCGHHRLEAS